VTPLVILAMALAPCAIVRGARTWERLRGRREPSTQTRHPHG
jgi:hypothetical protein